MVALRYSARVNGLTEIALTKLDVLSDFDTIRIATAYTAGGQRYTEFPRQQRVLYDCVPEYEEWPGWEGDISKIDDYDDLPQNARAYVERIEELAAVPIRTVSVGPGRVATLKRNA